MRSRLAVFFGAVALCLCGGFAIPSVPEGYEALFVAPKGLNSWDANMNSYNESEMLSAGSWAHSRGLGAVGFEFVVTDGGWWNDGASVELDEYGRARPLPSLFPRGLLPVSQALGQMGFSSGAWNIRGIAREAVERNLPIAGSEFRARDAYRLDRNCSWNSLKFGVNASSDAGRAWYDSMLANYVEQGLSFAKVDCLIPGGAGIPWNTDELMQVARSCAKYNVTLSTSPGAITLPDNLTQLAAVNVEAGWPVVRMMWVTGDFWDVWSCGGDTQGHFPTSLKNKFQVAHEFEQVSGVHGVFADLDMLPVGWISGHVQDCHLNHASAPSPSQFTDDEVKTLFTLFFIARAPLMLGAHFPEPAGADYSSLAAMLTNEEAMAVHDAASSPHQVSRSSSDQIVWTSTPAAALKQGPFLSPHGVAAPLAMLPDETARFVALFNAGNSSQVVSTTAQALGLPSQGCLALRDLWSKTNLPNQPADHPIESTLPPHAAALYKVSATQCQE